MSRDREKMLARRRRYRERKKIEKYGPSAAGVNMSGRHGNHACGPRTARWSGARRVTDHGYVAVRVALDHPHGWGPPGLKRFRYAYEHHVVIMALLGRSLGPDETVHHKNGDRADNRPENLEVLTRSEHAVEHAAVRPRDARGRFAPRVRLFPGDAWPEVPGG